MKWHWTIPVIVITLILGLFLSPDVFAAKQVYKTYDLESYNVGIEIDQSWRVLGIIDTDYYPGITLYDGWYENWRNQLRLGLIHNVGQSVNLQNFDEVTQYFEDYQREWCTDTKENPVWEVTPSEEGSTICLKMGNFTFNDVAVDGRQTYHASYQWTDEFRLPGGQLTADVYSGWTYWANLIPYGDDLIFVSGYTVNENVDEKKDIILHSLNSVKILNDGQPIFENTEPILVSTDKSSYNNGEMVTIRGQGAQSYSISIQITSSSGEEITKVSTFKTGAGDFSTPWIVPNGLEHGTYTITASDSSQTAQTTITIGTITPQAAEPSKSKTFIPSWVKDVAEFWIDDQIDDSGFVQVIEYLVQQEIITIPYAEAPEGEAAAEIPIWIKMNAEFWVNGKTSDDEFATALEWLINNGIIRV